MYFWQLGKLKRELASGPLPPRRALPYVIAWFASLSLVGAIPWSEPLPPWEWLAIQAVYYAIASGLGAWWSYRANGGAAGVDFAARLLAIWWVLGVRFLAVLFIPVIILYAILESGDDSQLYLADIVAAFVFTVPYYWRAAVHFRDLASATPPAASVSTSPPIPEAAA